MAIKISAYSGANFLPMAVPQVCRYQSLLKVKSLFSRDIFRSSKICVVGLEGSLYLLKVCSTALRPFVLSMFVYSASTSNVIKRE